MKSVKTLLGILAGTTVGLGLGILLAPGEGSVTRRRILEKGGYFGDAVIDKFIEMIIGVIDSFERAKQGITAFARKGRLRMVSDFKNAKNAAGYYD